VPEENQNLGTRQTQRASEPSSTSTLRDKRVVPEGVVPKQAQNVVIVLLAVLILLAVLFSKNHAKTTLTSLSNGMPFSNDANARKIAELEQTLSDEQRQSQQQPQPRTSSAGVAGSQVGASAPAAQSPASTAPQRDPVADAERALAFKSRFASNLVSADAASSHSSDSLNAALRSQDTGLLSTPVSGLPQESPSERAPTAGGHEKHTTEVSVNAAHGQPFVVFEGTTLDTALLNRLNGDFAGPAKVMVTNPIYSHDNQHVLIPEGTFLLGDVQKVAGLGQRRLAVTFHRMIMPDGYSVDLDKFHGLNQIGETGLKDQVNNHYVEIFGASIALGVIAGAAEATTNQGYNESGSDAIRLGLAESLSASAAHVLDRFINIMPTITIREGHRIKVYLTQDLLLPAYENHSIPGDI
jgi:type IV secretion system protein TrbI